MVGFLEWNASRRQADSAHRRLVAAMVDNNELRVTRTEDLTTLIGRKYPLVSERIERMLESLQDVFLREHAVSLDSLREQPKKDIRHYLETLGGIPPYVASQVLLLSFGGHALPVDDKTAFLLIEEGVVPEGAEIRQITSYLERQVKASNAVEAHMKLRAWADSKRRREGFYRIEAEPPPTPVKTKKTKKTRKASKKK